MNERTASIAERLAGLPVDDRAWILAQLSESERNLILGLLGEGAVPGPDLSVAIAVGSEKEKARSANPTGANIDQELNSASGEEMRELLAAENDWLIAVLLTAQEWPWAKSFLAATAPARLRRLRETVPLVDQRVRPIVKQSGVELVSQRLRAVRQQVVRPSFETMLQAIEDEQEALSRRAGSEP